MAFSAAGVELGLQGYPAAQAAGYGIVIASRDGFNGPGGEIKAQSLPLYQQESKIYT